MYDPTICTEETRIEGVRGQFAQAAHMNLELVYNEVRQTEDVRDPLFIGREPLRARDVLANIDTWSEGHHWQHPKLRTLAVALDSLESRNFAAELDSWANG